MPHVGQEGIIMKIREGEMKIIRERVIKELEKMGMNVRDINYAKRTFMAVNIIHSSPQNNTIRTSEGYIELMRIKIKQLDPEYKYDPRRIFIPTSWLLDFDTLAFVYKSKVIIIKTDDFDKFLWYKLHDIHMRYTVNLWEYGYKEDC